MNEELALRQLAPYPVALLQLMEGDEGLTANPFLGIAKRIGVETSTFNGPAHRLLSALIEHSLSPDSIAREFLVELGRCGNSDVGILGTLVFVPRSPDLDDRVFKHKQSAAVLAPRPLVNERQRFINNSRSWVAISPRLRSLGVTTFLIW